MSKVLDPEDGVYYKDIEERQTRKWLDRKLEQKERLHRILNRFIKEGDVEYTDRDFICQVFCRWWHEQGEPIIYPHE